MLGQFRSHHLSFLTKRLGLHPGKKDRTQFDSMMLATSQRQFDVLLFWKLDRLSREGVRKTLGYLERLDSWGVRWRSFMEPFFA